MYLIHLYQFSIHALSPNNSNIEDFYFKKSPNKYKNLNFQEVNKKIFPIIKIKNRITEYPSTPIIINAANEVLVSLFLSKKIPYLSISKTIMNILSDLNYRKYAIRNPKNIKDIIKIDHWARELTKKKLKYYD